MVITVRYNVRNNLNFCPQSGGPILCAGGKMKTMKGAVISAKGKIEISGSCPLPDRICPEGALIRPLIWSPCTSDAHLCATGCASLPYLLGNAVGHEKCGVITQV